MAIFVVAPWPILFLIFYGLLDKEPVQFGAVTAPKKEDHEDVLYRPINASPDQDEKPASCPRLPRGEKLQVALKILPFIIPLFLSFFAEYMSNSSVLTTIAFPNSNVLPRDHYLYYSLSYRIGKFVGRSYLFFFACFPDMAEFLKCRKTWIFAVLEMAHLIVFLFESWYHFVSYISVVIVMCSTLGLVAGMIVLHSPHAVANYVTPEEKEFALGLLTTGNAVGAFLAGLVGLYVEPFLTKECVTHFAEDQAFCFTRHSNMTGWDTNIHC